MKKRVFAGALGFISIATLAAQAQPVFHQCTASPCEVRILSATKLTDECKMVLDRDPIRMLPKKTPTTIVWHAPPGWQFCRQYGGGVFLKPNQPDDGQFQDPGVGVLEGKSFKLAGGNCGPDAQLHNMNSTPTAKTYYYNIVLHNSTGEACSWDPSIVNYP